MLTNLFNFFFFFSFLLICDKNLEIILIEFFNPPYFCRRVRCINSSAAKGGCKVAGYIIGEDRNGIWHLNGEEHTCELNENLELEIDFRYALYQACIAEKGGDREQIYDRVVKQG